MATLRSPYAAKIATALNRGQDAPLWEALDRLMAASWGQVDLATSTNVAGTYSGQVLTVTATGALSVDGTAVAVGDRVLLAGQSTGSQNGIYEVTGAGATGVRAVLKRAADAAASGDFAPGKTVLAKRGTANAGVTFSCSYSGTFGLDVTTPAFAATGASTARAMLSALGLRCGTATLVAGTVTVSDAATTAKTRIVAFPSVLANTTLTTSYSTPTQTVGSGFVLRANVAAGTINSADTSTLFWIAVEGP